MGSNPTPSAPQHLCRLLHNGRLDMANGEAILADARLARVYLITDELPAAPQPELPRPPDPCDPPSAAERKREPFERAKGTARLGKNPAGPEKCRASSRPRLARDLKMREFS